MTTTDVTPGAPLVLDGPVNFRDLGGYPAADGRILRRGRLFRSDGLWGVSERDVAHLVGRVGLRTVVDLRSPMEVERYGPGRLETTGLTVHRVAFFDQNLRPDIATDGTWTLDDLYLFLLRAAAPRVTAVLSVLASPHSHPAVFHCTAGKDRAGVVAALVLSLAGVDDEHIADDYARTAAVMPAFTERARRFLQGLGHDAPVFSEHVLTAERDTMLRLLSAVRDEFGSVEAWAHAHGLGHAQITALSDALLESPDR